MKGLSRFLIALAFASMPLFAHATTVADLQAQLQVLLQQIAHIQQQQGGTTSSSVSSVTAGTSICPTITRSLSIGVSGADVTALQQFLATDPSVYPQAQITGYYGSLTQAAVQRWQALVRKAQRRKREDLYK